MQEEKWGRVCSRMRELFDQSVVMNVLELFNPSQKILSVHLMEKSLLSLHPFNLGLCEELLNSAGHVPSSHW